MASFASRAVCLLLISLALFLAAAVQATPAESKQIVDKFGTITTLSLNLQSTAIKLNAVSEVLGEGFKVVDGFRGIADEVVSGTTMITAMRDVLADADAKPVVDALTTFEEVHQELLDIVIRKKGLIASAPVVGGLLEPFRMALVNLKKVLDGFAFALIAVIPTQQAVAHSQFDSLRETVNVAIVVYS